MKPQDFIPEGPEEERARIQARKNSLETTQSIGLKIKDLNNIFNDAKRHGDRETADAARTQLIRLSAEKSKLQPTEAMDEANEGIDTISMTVPLFIRALEWAKENASDDVALHQFTKNAIAYDGVIDIDAYDSLIPRGQVKENCDGGATGASSIAAGPAQNLLAKSGKKGTKKLVKRSAVGQGVYEAVVAEKHRDAPDDEYDLRKKKKKKIAELDNGPKGKEHSDNLNYDKNRNMTGTYVSKSEVEARKKAQDDERYWAKLRKEREQREKARTNPDLIVKKLTQLGEPMVADWNLEGGYDGVRTGLIDLANDERVKWNSKIIDKVLANWGVEEEDEQEIPKFDSDKPTTALEKKAQDAMWKVWNDIAPDLQSMHGSHAFERDFLNPYAVAEVCVDASRLVTNGDLSDEEEREILDNIDDETLARLCSRFGF